VIVVGVRLAPVGNVYGDNANAATGSGDRTRLRLWEPRPTLDPLDDVLESNPREDGHAVPGRLAMSSDLITPISELIPKHLSQRIISQLGFLKTNNIRPPLIEPGQ
jgi:hypothetical protein